MSGRVFGEVCIPFTEATRVSPLDPELLGMADEAAAKAGGTLGAFLEEREVLGLPSYICMTKATA